jgi:class 3 adenylate cyclase
VSPEGALLSASLVGLLAGSAMPSQYAQAAAPAAQQPIGRVETVSGSATVTRNGFAVDLNVGDLVFQGDVVQTRSDSTLGIDGSAFSLKENTRMALNEFVYVPNSTTLGIRGTFVNHFLTPLTNAIIERNGTIDKYIGDAITAFWNAPLDDPQQEVNACEAALEMLARADKLNRQFKHEADQNGGTYRPLHVGIGLNTGPCVVGNMGSDFRFNYSVLGDTVNVASRLEGRTKDYRIPIVIGAGTEQNAREKFATLEIDRIQVKGKTEPETVFTLLGHAELAQNPNFRELRDLTAKMLGYYREQDWTQALATIELCRKAAEPFGISALFDMYAERIEAFRRDPPPPDWNGVYEAESK